METTLSARTTQPKNAPTSAPPKISAQPCGRQEDHRQEWRIEVGVAQLNSSGVERARGDQPAEEDEQQQPRNDAHAVRRRTLQHIDKIVPVNVLLARFTAARELVKSGRCNGAEQSDPRDHREEEGHQGCAGRHHDGGDADQCVDQAGEDDVAAEGQEIVEPLPQRD